MPETLDDFLMTRPPTAERPLLGQTVLVVEDSRFACEALRMICQRSGARIRRADSIRSADRHLRTYRPGILLIDVGLPDGSGLELIRRITRAPSSKAVVIAMSGDESLADAARAAGACAFIAKPITSISAFQSAVLAELPKDARPTAIRPCSTDEVLPDRIALRDDLALAADLMRDEASQETMAYLAQFLTGVAKNADDKGLFDAARSLGDAVTGAGGTTAALARLRVLVADRVASEHSV